MEGIPAKGKTLKHRQLFEMVQTKTRVFYVGPAQTTTPKGRVSPRGVGRVILERGKDKRKASAFLERWLLSSQETREPRTEPNRALDREGENGDGLPKGKRAE